MIRMTMGVDDVRDRERLRLGPLHERLWRVGGIDQHADPRFAVAEHVSEVAVAPGPNLFEDESHLCDSISLSITLRGLFHSLGICSADCRSEDRAYELWPRSCNFDRRSTRA